MREVFSHSPEALADDDVWPTFTALVNADLRNPTMEALFEVPAEVL